VDLRHADASSAPAVVAATATAHQDPDRWMSPVAPGNQGSADAPKISYRWRRVSRGEGADEGSATLEVHGDTKRLEVDVSETFIHLSWPSTSSELGPRHTLRLPLGFVTDPDNCQAVRRRKADELHLTFPRAAALASPVQSLTEQIKSKEGDSLGYVDSFMAGCELDMIRNKILDMWEAGRLEPGEVEGGERKHLRSDKYLFLEDEQDPVFTAFTSRLDSAVLQLVREVPYLKKRKLLRGRPMAAVYGDAGARYVPHFDCIGGDNGRVITAILYLNPFWREVDGARMCVWPDVRQLSLQRTGRSREIDPIHGRLAAFVCDSRNLHEVMPLTAGDTVEPRVAISCWYYDSELLPGIVEREGELPADAPV